MSEELQEFSRVHTSYQIAFEQARACLTRLSEDMGSDGAQKNSVYQEKLGKARDLFWEREGLVHVPISTNLGSFGLSDMRDLMVAASFQHDGKDLSSAEMSLAHLCALGHAGLARQNGWNIAAVSPCITVNQGGRNIGSVNADCIFHYHGAQNCRAALACIVATDAGRYRLLGDEHCLDRAMPEHIRAWMPGVSFNTFISEAADRIVQMIRKDGHGGDVFFGGYRRFLNEVFVCGQTTRFQETHESVVKLLWQTAVKEASGVDYTEHSPL